MAITKTVTVRLEVTEPPDFFPEVVPTVLSVVKGIVAQYLCSIVGVNAFAGRVRLSVDSAPAGAILSFSQEEIGLGDVAELNIETSGVDAGAFDFQVIFTEVE